MMIGEEILPYYFPWNACARKVFLRMALEKEK